MARRSLAPRMAMVLRHGLDALIGIEFAAILLVAFTGGGSFGWFSATRVAKPILVLIVAIPIRMALGGPTWPAHLLNLAKRRLAVIVPAGLADQWRILHAIRDVAVAMALTRFATISVGFFANLLMVPSRERFTELPFEWKHLAHTFAAWDSGWYFDIARRGYYFSEVGQSSVAFFPLYPMLMRLVAWLAGGSERAFWAAGIVVSFVATFCALVVLHRLTERLTGRSEVARRTVLYVCVFPFSLFLTRIYAEGTFLLASVVAVAAAYHGRWWLAGIAGGLTALARPNGILIVIPLTVLAFQGRPSDATMARRCLALAMIPGGLALFCWYVWSLSGHPLGWLTAQDHWGYSLGHPPWQQLLKLLDRLERHGPYGYFFVSEMAPYRFIHGMTAFAVVGMTPFVFKQFGAPLGLYVAATLLVPLTGNALEGIGRYSAVLFPVFMSAAMMTSTRTHEALLIIGSLFLAGLVVLFVTLHPVY